MLNASLSGKVVVITGTTHGIGRVLARELAGAGATLELLNRNPRLAAAQVEELVAATGNPRISSEILDLSDFDSVRKAAKAIAKQHPVIDVLINNAGAFFLKRECNKEGVEMTFAVNFLGPFLLTRLLLPNLERSSPGRILITSSKAHEFAELNLGDLAYEGGYPRMGFSAYAASKLATLLFTQELARRLDAHKVTINAVHPGVVATNIWPRHNLFWRALMRAMDLRRISPEEGARTLLYLAQSPDVEGVTGGYWFKKKLHKVGNRARNPQLQQDLWRKAEELCKLTN